MTIVCNIKQVAQHCQGRIQDFWKRGSCGVRFADFISFFLNISGKRNNLISLRPNYFIFIAYLKTGAGRGFKQTPWTPLDPPLVYTTLPKVCLKVCFHLIENDHFLTAKRVHFLTAPGHLPAERDHFPKKRSNFPFPKVLRPVLEYSRRNFLRLCSFVGVSGGAMILVPSVLSIQMDDESFWKRKYKGMFYKT